MTNPPLPPSKIALVIDGEVLDVLHTDDRLAAIFLSEPTIVDATEWMANNKQNLVGGTWDGQTFTPVNNAEEPTILTKEEIEAIAAANGVTLVEESQ